MSIIDKPLTAEIAALPVSPEVPETINIFESENTFSARFFEMYYRQQLCNVFATFLESNCTIVQQMSVLNL